MSDTSQPLTTPFYLHLMQYLAIDIALAMYIFACVCSIKLFRVYSIPELQYSRLNGFSVSSKKPVWRVSQCCNVNSPFVRERVGRNVPANFHRRKNFSVQHLMLSVIGTVANKQSWACDNFFYHYDKQHHHNEWRLPWHAKIRKRLSVGIKMEFLSNVYYFWF